ncbi:hypothetical protein Tco_1208686 [Tanacetum coccineum]
MANIPLFHELSRVDDSHDIRDQLSVLFRREVAKDLVKMEDYFKLSNELRIGVEMRDGYISELQRYDMSKEVLESIEILRLMQVDNMEKASRLALMAREIQDKVNEKNTFIAKLRDNRAGSSSAGRLVFPSPISSSQEANELTRLRSSKVMSGLASLMFYFNVKTLKDGHNADSEMQDAIISIFDAPFFTGSVCRKSPPRRTDLPPNKEDELLTMSPRLLSSASKQ